MILQLGSVIACNLLLTEFFFFKRKKAYKFRHSVVGSEICIRDILRADDLSNCKSSVEKGNG
ncbi:hypothetical protein C7U77_04935 [Escherichia coli]|nr:hypothetical protein C7U77_04935 [Escherichia coli]